MESDMKLLRMVKDVPTAVKTTVQNINTCTSCLYCSDDPPYRCSHYNGGAVTSVITGLIVTTDELTVFCADERYSEDQGACGIFGKHHQKH